MTFPGPNGGNLHFGANCAVPNAGLQDPGLHSNSQDPGPSFHPQHHVSARPFFYVHPPPPPPFLQYQWPMPFSYNPFAGYPGMGYGMVMPSFPPPPYMDPSAYLLPQPHIQAVDYRRLLHPQAHAPSVPFQNQTRRARPPHTVQYRETMNSEVQTESTHREAGGYGGGSLLASSDSGHGTTSNSPSSSSSPLKRDPASVENHNLPGSNTEDFQLNKTSKSITVKHGSNIPHPTKTVNSCIREPKETQKSCTDTICQENVPPCRSAHCNIWSVSSPDNMVPICSSSQEENEVAKERRVSIPDILMSWAGVTPQSKVIRMTDKVLPHCNHQVLSQTELEHERPLYRSPTVTQEAPVITDSTDGNDAVGILSSKASENFKILKLPKISDEQEDGNDTNLEEDTPEVSHNEMPFNSYRMRRKMNESVWSVESLPLFAPTKEWLLQNGMLEPDVIVEMTEEAENCEQSTESDDLIVKGGKMKQHCRIPPKVPELDYEMYASEMKGPTQGQCVTPENIPLISMTGLQNKIESPLTAKDVDGNGSSEPEANQSPNQEPLIVNGQKARSPCPLAHEAVLHLSPTLRKEISVADHLIVQNVVDIEVEDETCGNEEVSRLRNEQLCVPVAKPIMTEVSPSRGHLVDCGIQCTELQEPCPCREGMDDMETKRRHPLKYSDVKMANKGQDEGFGGHMPRNQKRHYQRRNRVSEEHSRQQEPFSSYYGKSGKSRGDNHSVNAVGVEMGDGDDSVQINM